MLILALDTTSENGGVGIFRDASCLALVPNEGPPGEYSITLFEMVERARAEAHIELGEIDLFAAANGPGSFTGIRVGLAAARAWGRAFGRPVRGVSVLEAMVGKARPASDWAFPIVDARRGEFFLGSFRKSAQAEPAGAVHSGGSAPGHDYEPADAGWILKPESLRAFVEERLASGAGATCLVRAHDRAAVELLASLPAAVNRQWLEGILVDSIAAIARKEECAGRPSADANLDAYYLRRPDAEVNWKG